MEPPGTEAPPDTPAPPPPTLPATALDLTLSSEEMRVDLALRHCNGDRKMAAEVLGITVNALKMKLKRSGPLSAKWGKPRNKERVVEIEIGVDGVNASIEAMPPTAGLQTQPVLVTETEAEKAAQALERMKTAMGEMGVEQKSAELAAAMHRFYASHTLHGLSMLGGGLVLAATECLEMASRLKTEPYHDEFTPDLTLLKSGQRTSDEMRLRCFEMHGKKTLEFANLLVMQKRLTPEEGNSGNKPARKAGFAPLRSKTNVLAQAGSTVVVTGGQNGNG